MRGLYEDGDQEVYLKAGEWSSSRQFRKRNGRFCSRAFLKNRTISFEWMCVFRVMKV